MSAWFAEVAWLPAVGGRAVEDVLIEEEAGRITRVTVGAAPPAGANRLPGLVLPGLANTHSHAFQRALRGRTEAGHPTFWDWREEMYRVADRLDPDSYGALARAAYAEMALAGITAVGEFHYVHHDPGGRPYSDPNAMQEALAGAAAAAGVRITLLDTCYLRGGFDEEVSGVQRRFCDGDADRWAERAAARRSHPHVRLGAAVHSVRAVDPGGVAAVAGWARRHGATLHVHVSEQRGENQACVAATGRTPAQLLADCGALGQNTTAVHATHLTVTDVQLLGATGTRVCLCPTTERFLGDGAGPGAALAAAGCPLSVGTDSHASVDLFEEARSVELHERLATRARGHHNPRALLRAATRGGMQALGWDSGQIAPGALCDLVAVDLGAPRMAGFDPAQAAGFAVFAAAAADVTHVVVGGRLVVDGGEHLLVGDVGWALRQAIAAVAG